MLRALVAVLVTDPDGGRHSALRVASRTFFTLSVVGLLVGLLAQAALVMAFDTSLAHASKVGMDLAFMLPMVSFILALALMIADDVRTSGLRV